jgi:hypothetical protein
VAEGSDARIERPSVDTELSGLDVSGTSHSVVPVAASIAYRRPPDVLT